ncbi:phosphatase PAP2 family protein [Bacillus songklensis]|uniref:phosphatase PAP2 family protein n=1 Tax=Bacillus songklensis TaxID=1069116 RepID=UPI003673024C
MGRTRPGKNFIGNDGGSFPSGHMLYSCMFYGFILFIIWCVLMENQKKAAAWLAGLSFFIFLGLVGVSRIYLGDHYASDVLGGFFLGAAYLLFFFMVLTHIWKKGWR